MARIELDGIGHSYQTRTRAPVEWAVRGLDHVWEDGGAYALLGPSGCGKTTVLNIISGLVRPSEGRVRFDGVDVTDERTERRNIAQVFQFPVVYDTMTVRDNLAFPLRNRGHSEAEVRARVAEVAEMLELTPVLGRRAAGLGAEAKQTISLGRGLVRSDVAAILFDEPLTVIDPHLKWILRRRLKQIHERLALTLVYVTHDQHEALTFADRVVVMDRGEVLQVGTPRELFEAPAHTTVGHFIGSPGMNFLPCVLDEGAGVVEDVRIPLAPGAVERAGTGGEALLGIRPEFLDLRAEPAQGGVPVAIDAVEDLGSHQMVTVRLAGHPVKAKVPEDTAVPADRAWLLFDPAFTKIYVEDRLVA